MAFEDDMIEAILKITTDVNKIVSWNMTMITIHIIMKRRNGSVVKDVKNEKQRNNGLKIGKEKIQT